MEYRLLGVALGAFGVFGSLWGVWAVLLTDLARSLHLSAGPLGIALSGGVAASFPVMFLGGRAADRWGRRVVLVCSGALMAVSFGSLAFAQSYTMLLCILLFWCATSGVYDVVVNAFAMDLERATGRRIMSVLHAAFSMGGAVGALISGLLISSGANYQHVYLGSTLPVLALILFAWKSPFPPAEEPIEDEGVRTVGLYRSLPVILVGVVAVLAFFSEGTMEDWSGVYLRQTLELPTMLGASGVAVYHLAMAGGRLGATGIIKRFGNRSTLAGAGLLMAVGMTLALATRAPLLIVIGFLVVGLALAAVTPIAFSVAGDLAPSRAGEASSVVATLGYNGFLLGPALIGGIAELSSLRFSLIAIVLAGLLISALSRSLVK